MQIVVDSLSQSNLQIDKLTRNVNEGNLLEFSKENIIRFNLKFDEFSLTRDVPAAGAVVELTEMLFSMGFSSYKKTVSFGDESLFHYVLKDGMVSFFIYDPDVIRDDKYQNHLADVAQIDVVNALLTGVSQLRNSQIALCGLLKNLPCSLDLGLLRLLVEGSNGVDSETDFGEAPVSHV